MLRSEMRVVQQLGEDLWRSFVDDNPRGTIFHTPEMFHVFAQANGHRPELWEAVACASEVLALIAPVHATLMGGILRRLTTRSVVYGSILWQDTAQGQEALRLLLQTYTRNMQGRSLFTELRNFGNLEHLQPLLKECGYAHEDHLNYLIDLSRPVEEILQQIGTRTRKKIRKGLRDGHVEIVEIND